MTPTLLLLHCFSTPTALLPRCSSTPTGYSAATALLLDTYAAATALLLDTYRLQRLLLDTYSAATALLLDTYAAATALLLDTYSVAVSACEKDGQEQHVVRQGAIRLGGAQPDGLTTPAHSAAIDGLATAAAAAVQTFSWTFDHFQHVLQCVIRHPNPNPEQRAP